MINYFEYILKLNNTHGVTRPHNFITSHPFIVFDYSKFVIKLHINSLNLNDAMA